MVDVSARAKTQKSFGSFLQKRTSSLALVGLGALDILYGIGSAVFGDGYIETPRHEVLVLVGAAAFISGLVAYLTAGLSAGSSRG